MLSAPPRALAAAHREGDVATVTGFGDILFWIATIIGGILAINLLTDLLHDVLTRPLNLVPLTTDQRRARWVAVGIILVVIAITIFVMVTHD
jgi:hypothetical protein